MMGNDTIQKTSCSSDSRVNLLPKKSIHFLIFKIEGSVLGLTCNNRSFTTGLPCSSFAPALYSLQASVWKKHRTREVSTGVGYILLSTCWQKGVHTTATTVRLKNSELRRQLGRLETLVRENDMTRSYLEATKLNWLSNGSSDSEKTLKIGCG